MEGLNHKIWDEWGAVAAASSSAARDEAAGIIDGFGYNTENGECCFSSARLFAVRRLMRLWCECFTGDEQQSSGIRLGRSQQRGKLFFSIPEEQVLDVISATRAASKRTRNWNWVRGIFGGCGSLYVPRTGYFLILRPPEGCGPAGRVQAILRSCGFALGVRKRMGCKELMLRDQQQIVTLLSRIGLVKTALSLEETAIYRSMRNHANKLVNCDAANINKSLEAARGQLRLIEQMEKLGLTTDLPEPLFELVCARKRNPSISLKELGQTLPTPISKSTVEYRWRKLENMLSKQLKGDDANVLRKGGC